MERNRKTTKQFIEEAINIHGNLYDYSNVNYIRAITKIKIMCKLHGIFEQTPNSHLSGHGCPKCASERVVKSNRYSNEKFIEKAKEVHGDKYDYSLIIYKNSSSKVKIICPIHGIFEQSYQKHCVLGRGCWDCGKKACADKIRLSQEQFIEKAKEVHGDRYDYSLVEYKSSQEKIKIICPTHGVFEQLATSHSQGFICKDCSYIKGGKSCRKGKEKILEAFYKKHGDFYSYDMPDDVKTSDKITIKCPNHGEFSQIVSVHYKSGCPKCGDERVGEFKRKKPKELDRICRNLRRRLKHFMQKKGFKKAEKTCDVIGCTWDYLKKHLEDNPYNFKVDCLDLDTDHIIPISSAKTEEEVYLLSHYTNLQLLPKAYNQYIKKANPFDRNHFEDWLLKTNYDKC